MSLQQRQIPRNAAHSSVLVDYFPTFKGLNPHIEIVIGTTTKEIHMYYRDENGNPLHSKQIIEYTDSTKVSVKTVYPAEVI